MDLDNEIIKSIWKNRGTRTAKSTLKGKNKHERTNSFYQISNIFV